MNVGTKGFMAGLEPEDLELVRRAASGRYRRSLRMMLDVELLKSDGEVLRDCALNDAVVKSDVNCINLTVLADGTEITASPWTGSSWRRLRARRRIRCPRAAPSWSRRPKTSS